MAVKKRAGRWSGTKKTSHAAAGKRDAETDRKLQRQAERKRSPKPRSKKTGAVQAGSRPYPAPPLPKQHQEKPGRETDLEPRPPSWRRTISAAASSRAWRRSITGGDSGIGRAVAVLFAREGADVAIVYLSEDEDAEETRAGDRGGGPPLRCSFAGDVKDSGVLPRGRRDRRCEAFGGLDILVNNAAFQQHADIARGHHRRALRGDAPHQHLRLLPHGARRAAAPEGRRVDHQHRLGDRPRRAARNCSTTRRPRARSTPSPSRWRRTCSSTGIRVNAVAPGPVWTPLNPADSGRGEGGQVRRGQPT